jgi:phosphoribosylglycinamide formyltransferase 2
LRAILGFPIPHIRSLGPSASTAILIEGDTAELQFSNLQSALVEPDTTLRLFGKPEVRGQRRMGVALARADNIDEARRRSRQVAAIVTTGAQIAD